VDNYTKVEPASPNAFPIAKAGLPFIGIAAFTTAVFALLGLAFLALTGLVATLFICYFFRDPDRVVPDRDGAVVSPADGKVIKVETVAKGRFYNESCLKISIFMSIFNVHVNRVPFSGEIARVAYFPGKFFSANLDKASSDNEHNAVFLKTDKGREICFVQIAGLVARRIICHVQEGQTVKRGQRFGLICFGSRLDVYLPTDTNISVKVGDRVRAGTSVLGELPL
jgi:phosphatidylserine decarboxylase